MVGFFWDPVLRTFGGIRRGRGETAARTRRADPGLPAERVPRPTPDRYDLLIEASGLGFFEWHDLGDPETFICSPRMIRLCGFGPEVDRLGLKEFQDRVHPDDRTFQQWDGPEPESGFFEYRFRVRDQFRWFRTRRVVRSAGDGRPTSMIGSFEDVHDHRLDAEKLRALNQTLEEQVRQRTQQLEGANEAKSRFLAHMSHEIRTPLGLILGFSELLAGNTSLNDEAREYLELIVKNGEILSRVVNDLLDLSKVEAGRLKLLFSEVDLGNLLRETRSAFFERAQSKRLHLQIEDRIPAGTRIVTDEIRLKQVIYNLISNALKFTDEGAVSVICSESVPGRVFRLDVVDTGVGIPANEQDRLFGEYMRSEWADSSRTAGTGLGLRLAKSLAEAMDGQLELVFSAPGQGTHFRLTFVNQKAASSPVDVMDGARGSETVEAGGATVFVLDDNVDNIRLAEIFLHKLGCRTRGFTDPREFIETALAERPALAFLDILMPEMNGIEVFKRLRERGFDAPVWALTAYALNDDVQQILGEGFNGYVRKPINLVALRKILIKELKERTLTTPGRPAD